MDARKVKNRAKNNIAYLLYLLLRIFLRILIGGKKRRDSFLISHYGEKGVHGCVLTFFGFLPNTLRDLVELTMLNAFIDKLVSEKKVSEFLQNLKGELFIDIGANIGHYVLMLHNNFDRIIALEPLPLNMKFLLQNIRYEKIKNVTCVKMAVSDEDTTLPLYLPTSGFIYPSLFKRSESFSRKIMVKTCTLASFLKNEQKVDLVKVDVEGAEWKVLEGSKPILGRIGSWIVELHDLTEERKLERWFNSNGYKTLWLDSAHIYAWKLQ